MSKQDCYSAKPELDEFDSIGDRLALDLRKNIRQLVCILFRIFEIMTFYHDVWYVICAGKLSNIIRSMV